MAAAEPVSKPYQSRECNQSLRQTSSQLRKSVGSLPGAYIHVTAPHYEMRRSEEEARWYSTPFLPFSTLSAPDTLSSPAAQSATAPPSPHDPSYPSPTTHLEIIPTTPSLSQTSSAASYHQPDHHCRRPQAIRGTCSFFLFLVLLVARL